MGDFPRWPGIGDFFLWPSSLESSGIDGILYPRVGATLCSEISGIGSIPISVLESSGSGFFSGYNSPQSDRLPPPQGKEASPCP